MLGIFLDIETTGLDPVQHAPIDIAIKLVDLQTMTVIDEYQSLIKQPEEVWKKSDPISLEINGYSREGTQTGKEPAVAGDEIISLFLKNNIERTKAFFICQNPAFDRSFFTQIIPVYDQEKLNWPYHWLDLASMYWTKVIQDKEIYPKTINLSKNTIAKEYGLPEEERPHCAINGVDHLILCYKAVMK